MTPVFSVVLPVENGADTIARSVVSVLAQTFADLELIVVDADSRDGTPDAVRMVADGRVRLLAATDLAEAVARGTERARGTFITVLDADTVVRPHWLSRVARLAQQHRADLVACGGVQHHRDHSSTEVRADIRCSRPGAVLRRRELSEPRDPGEAPASITTPELLVDWFEPAASVAASPVEQRLRWATDAMATLGASPIPSADLLSRYATLAGLAAARLHRHPEARRLLGIARQLNWRDPRYWARWAVASLPPLSDLVWTGAERAPLGDDRLAAGSG
ncbi:MAG: glycosyltransferase family 2 protein [Microthrixaceae bacterium]